MAGADPDKSSKVKRSATAPVVAREPVTLVKGAHRWTFSCEPGEEPALLRALTELAGDDGKPFDWFDAALVSHQLSKRLRSGLNRKK